VYGTCLLSLVEFGQWRKNVGHRTRFQWRCKEWNEASVFVKDAGIMFLGCDVLPGDLIARPAHQTRRCERGATLAGTLDNNLACDLLSARYRCGKS
jgi:hypothetical protein